jgi:hypothetical protein
MAKHIVFALLITGIASAQTEPKHLSEYMQRVALIYLDTAHSEEVQTARTLENDTQEKILDDMEAQIKITLQHRSDGPEKAADEDFMQLLFRVRILAGAAGLEVNQSRKDGPATRAWSACFAFAKGAAEGGTIYPQIGANCDSLYETYSKTLKEQYELTSKCATLKKKKDQRACEAGKIPPPS